MADETGIVAPDVDEAGLPAWRCDDIAAAAKGCAEGEPTVPIGLIGNHGCTIFTHGDGRYELLTGERSWARLNDAVHARLQVDDEQLDLCDATGCIVGCGVMTLSYRHPRLRIERRLSCPPSAHYGERLPVCCIALTVHNPGPQRIELAWEEGCDARYDFLALHNPAFGKARVRYPATGESAGPDAFCRFDPQPDMPLVLAEGTDPAWQESHPPRCCLHAEEGEVAAESLDAERVRLSARRRGVVEPGQTVTWRCYVGFVQADQDWPTLVASAKQGAGDAYRAAWRAVLPDWPRSEHHAEMRWHACVLQAMATWSAWYEEVFIPQGTVYEYRMGCSAVIRDHLQHALPGCRAMPELAAGALRFAVKHTDPWGNIRKSDEGANQYPIGGDIKSDLQLYALYLLSEYLRAGHGFDLLHEPVHFIASPRPTTLLDCAGRWLRFLRDEVGRGPHGLVRLLNSDWNDSFYQWLSDLPYGRVFRQAESGLNSAMAVAVLGRLADALDGEPAAQPLVGACRACRAELLDALMEQLGGRDFLPRAWVGDRVIGDDECFFEPQPWLLLIPELTDRHAAIQRAIQTRLLDGEKRAARQREQPGSRENGGVWFALNGPYLQALAEVDPASGRALLEGLSNARHRRLYPDRWIGSYSHGDSFDSSMHRDPARRDRVASYLHPMPVFCAHAHAWPLFGMLLALETSG